MRDVVQIVIAIALMAFTAFMLFYPFPNVIYLPGSADSVGERLSVRGGKEYPTDDKVYWATVEQKLEPRFLDMVDAWIRDEVDVEKRQEVLGDLNADEARKYGQIMMDDSKVTASIVVAKRLGLPITPGSIRILDVDPSSPSAKLIRPDDEIDRIDGKSLCLSADIREVLRRFKPGDTVSIGVKKQGKGPSIPTDVRLGDGGRGRPMIGISVGPSALAPCRASVEVKVKTGGIGGPSAGLAITLALLDRLSEGSLTGSVPIAATGTIEADGSVGLVGGVKQKTFAVKRAGAKVFFVPKDEVADARRWAGNMKVVGVSSLDEALLELEKLGGDPLPNNNS